MTVMSVAQNDAKCKTVFEMKNSRNDAEALTFEIFDGGNQKAREFLASVGYKRFQKECDFYPLREIAKLFELNEQYVLGVLKRRGVTVRKTPDDMAIINTKTGKRYMSLAYQSEIYISPRAALAIVAIAFYGRRIPRRDVVRKIFYKLMKTDYFDAVSKSRARARAEAAKAAAVAKADKAAAFDLSEFADWNAEGRRHLALKQMGFKPEDLIPETVDTLAAKEEAEREKMAKFVEIARNSIPVSENGELSIKVDTLMQLVIQAAAALNNIKAQQMIH